MDSPAGGLRTRIHEVIFEARTPTGKLFDIGLIVAILASLTVVMLDSVESIHDAYGPALYALEWVFTVCFTIEYGLRLYCVGRPLQYARSFFGVIDLLSVLPSYLSLIFTGSQSLLVIRTLRLLRIFRVLKLARFLSEARTLAIALKSSRHKIIVFLTGVFCAVVIAGAAMYLIENRTNPEFSSIPESMYWAVVTMTTVGYGDIAPESSTGKLIASVLMVLGYGIIAVPTGIVSAELVQISRVTNTACPQCSLEGHEPDAVHCKGCGAKL